MAFALLKLEICLRTPNIGEAGHVLSVTGKWRASGGIICQPASFTPGESDPLGADLSPPRGSQALGSASAQVGALPMRSARGSLQE